MALIPARAGSKRIPGKNIKLLGGKPLVRWTVEAAHESDVFGAVIVCSDSKTICGLARTGWRLQKPPCHVDDCCDITWVRDALQTIDGADAFAILRPTSPFRTADTIRRAVEQFKTAKCSSIRAVERVKQHPGKMWLVAETTMQPVFDGVMPTGYGLAPFHSGRIPFHSQPTQVLPPVYVQNSSLEIAHRWCVDIFGTISGPKVAPFFTEGMEGFSIDYPDDWERAERHVAALQAIPSA